jgi:PAS domain-containing protein
MDEHKHEALVSGLYRQMKEIFENSEQAMYLYLDDVHKVCNKRFADLLGYDSPKAWATADEPFPLVFVASKSRGALVSAYQDAIERFVGATIDVAWQTKSGQTVDSQVILVPVAYEGHVFALHFINPR